MLFLFHKLEKGIVMPGKKRVFGEAVVKDLLSIISVWHDAGYSQKDIIYLASIETMRAYVEVIKKMDLNTSV